MSKETKIEFIANTKIYILMRFFKKKKHVNSYGKRLVSISLHEKFSLNTYKVANQVKKH